MALLEEITRPGIRNLKIKFKGMRTARVYPEELPNLPVGMQQIVLGRYLPEGKDQKGRVIISGIDKGKKIEFKKPVILKDAESGNSFIPRLWARMHLDSLLEQGRSSRVKADIIALSEEYNIMTPFTSLLILESDEDRERFKVKKRFRMRDGEKFFAKGRETANFELRQKYMQLAEKWRQDLRRRILRELFELGRFMPEQRRQYRGTHGANKYYNGYNSLGWAPMFGSVSGNISVQNSPSDMFSSVINMKDNNILNRFGTINGYFEEDTKEIKNLELGEKRYEYMADYSGKPEEEIDAIEMSLDIKTTAGRGFVPFSESLAGIKYNMGYFTAGSDKYGRYQDKSKKSYNYLKFVGTPRDLRGKDYDLNNYYQINQLFPHLPSLPVQKIKKAQHLPKWPEEARKLAERLLRQPRLNQMTGGIEIKLTHKNWNVRRKRLTGQTKYKGLYSPDEWIQTINTEGQQTLTEWYDKKYRGIAAPCFQLGRKRKAEDTDKNFYHHRLYVYNDHSFTSLADTYYTYTPEIKKQDNNIVLLIIRHPNSPGHKQHFLIDIKRNLILKIETFTKEKLNSRTIFSDFIKAGNCWWATKISRENAEGEQTALTTASIKSLTRKIFKARITQEKTKLAKTILLNEPLPTLVEAKQALHDRNISKEDYLILILHHTQLQQWEKVKLYWDRARKLIKGLPGELWLADAILEISRRNEELKLRLFDRARKMAKGKWMDEYYLATFLKNKANRFAQANERLELLKYLKPIYERQSKYLMAEKQYQRSHAAFLSKAGRSEEALAIRKKTAEKYIFDTSVQTEYFNDMVKYGEAETALKWIKALLDKPDHWNQSERDSIRSRISYHLAEKIPLEKLFEYLKEWMAEETANSTAYKQYLTVLFRMNKADKAGELIKRWIKEGLSYQSTEKNTKKERALMARFDAAIQAALGRGYNMYSNYIDPQWFGLLSEAVKKIFRSKPDNYIASRIMNNHQFRDLDEARKLRSYFSEVLKKEAGKLLPTQINKIINWISRNDPPVKESIWDKAASIIKKRWTQEKNSNTRHQLGQSLISLLRIHSRKTRLLEFLRKQYKEGPEEYYHIYINQLVNELYSAKWSKEIEDELFKLLGRLTQDKEEEKRINTLFPALYEIVNKMVQARYQKAVDAVLKKEDMSRTEYRAMLKEKQTRAREGIIKRLKNELERQEEILKPWLIIEHLGLEIKLNKDAKKIAEKCWELLPPEPLKEKDILFFKAHLINRSLTALSCLAVRKSAEGSLIKKLLEYIDKGIKINPESQYWKYLKYRLLTALDRPAELKKALKKWISPGKADNTWRLMLGYLMAEMNRIDEAILQFEAIEQTDELGPADYRALAGWYTIKGEKQKNDNARIKALMVNQEYMLSQRLREILRPWRQNKNMVPEELNPESIQIFKALFKKANKPQNYIYQLSQFYKYTRDFRLLQCLPEAVIGHTAQQIYPFIQNLKSLFHEIHDEATVDSIADHIKTVLSQAKTRVDKRALDLLTLQVKRRAAELHNQPGPHIRTALKAMKQAFTGQWQKGERRLMADFISSLGRISSDELSREQIRELIALHKSRTEPLQDRLHISWRLAETLWAYNKQDKAIDRLETALAEYRDASGNILQNTANSAFNTFIQYLEYVKRFTRAETYLLKELKQPANKSQADWLMERKFRLYINTISGKGRVSLGEGKELYNRVLKQFINELDTSTQKKHRKQLISLICDFFQTAERSGLKPKRLREFAFDLFPKFINRDIDRYDYHNNISNLAETLKTLLGIKTGLEFLIERMEEEPEWLCFVGRSGWQQHGYKLARWRHKAKNISDLEDRLLLLVKKALRRDLQNRRSHNRNIYHLHNSYFWSEKADDFMDVAESVWQEQKGSGLAVKYIAEYMFKGLEQKKRAIEILFEAYKNKLLYEPGQALLAEYLHKTGRYDESIPILLPLIKLKQDTITYRTQLMYAYYKTDDREALGQLLAKTDKHFHKKGLWKEDNIASLGKICLDTELFRESTDYYNELIPLYKRTHRKRSTGSRTLSRYYTELSGAYTGLKQTVNAVEAASGAIICWNNDLYERKRAINSLRDTLAKAPDLEKYVEHLEKQAEKTGLENPIARKVLGMVYFDKEDYESAVRHLQIAAQTQPNDSETFSLIIKAYDQMEDPQGAIKQLLALTELSRRNISLYSNLGARYDKMQMKDKAKRAYLSIVEMLPNESESHAMLARIRQKEGRWEKAIHHWRQVARIRSLEPAGLLNLAKALVHEKQWTEAKKIIKTLLSKDWPQRFNTVHNEVYRLKKQIPDE